ncbi:MAG: DUF1476 family protein [bacterium]|nr:DUF1476 family protein [bacterium]
MKHSIDVREQAMEDGFQNQSLIQFKVIARRNKLFGTWAGKLMDFDEAETQAYTKKLIADACNLPTDTHLIQRVRGDLKKKNLALSEFKLKKRLEYCFDDALKQVNKGV